MKRCLSQPRENLTFRMLGQQTLGDAHLPNDVIPAVTRKTNKTRQGKWSVTTNHPRALQHYTEGEPRAENILIIFYMGARTHNRVTMPCTIIFMDFQNQLFQNVTGLCLCCHPLIICASANIFAFFFSYTVTLKCWRC